MEVIHFVPGALLRHIARGSTYRVIALASASLDVEDDSEGYFCEKTHQLQIPGRPVGGAIQVVAQIDPQSRSVEHGTWVIYLSLDGEKAGQTYARPLQEFTSKRFVFHVPQVAP